MESLKNEEYKVPDSRFLMWIKKITDFIDKFLILLCGISILSILVIMLMNVVFREFFNSSLLWSNDLAGYLLVYITFMSAPVLLKEDGHVKVDILLDSLPRKATHIIEIFISLIISIVMFLFSWFGFKITSNLYSNNIVLMENIPWPKYLLIAPVAIGSLLLSIYSILILIRRLRELKRN